MRDSLLESFGGVSIGDKISDNAANFITSHRSLIDQLPTILIHKTNLTQEGRSAEICVSDHAQRAT
jgi:hypothetical protein